MKPPYFNGQLVNPGLYAKMAFKTCMHACMFLHPFISYWQVFCKWTEIFNNGAYLYKYCIL